MSVTHFSFGLDAWKFRLSRVLYTYGVAGQGSAIVSFCVFQTGFHIFSLFLVSFWGHGGYPGFLASGASVGNRRSDGSALGVGEAWLPQGHPLRLPFPFDIVIIAAPGNPKDLTHNSYRIFCLVT